MLDESSERRDFFVSFNSADREYAEWIAATLEEAGWRVIFQHWDFRPGNNFVLEMDRAARLADRVITVLSENYLKAMYTQPEWARLFADDPTGTRRKVVPVRVAACTVDGLLKPVIYIDLVGCGEDESRRRLLDGVKEGRAKPPHTPFPGGGGGAPTREEEVRHLETLIAREEEKAERYSPLRGIEAKGKPGGAGRRRKAVDEADIALLRLRSRPEAAGERQVAGDFDDILQAFAARERVALLGAPGSGKSTSLRKLAVELARAAKEDARAPLPVLATLGSWTGAEGVLEFLKSQAPEVGWAVEALGRAGRLVLLLDGLNEMPTLARKGKTEEIVGLVGRLPVGTKVVVSCRAQDHVGELDLGWDTLTLEPLSPQRIRAALRHWMAGEEERLFWQLAGDEQLAGVLERWKAAGASEEAFWEGPRGNDWDWSFVYKVGWQEHWLWKKHLGDTRSLLKLAANPFLLNMLYLVWDGALPKNRGELFSRFVDRLLYREGLVVHEGEEWRRTEDGERLLRGLSELAWRMQRVRVAAGAGQSGDYGVLTVTTSADALEAVGDAGLLRKAVDGTLLEGEEEVRFRHQLLQEYFTAVALREQMKTVAAVELWPAEKWWERSGWEEAAVLLAGLYSEDCSEVVRWIARAQPEVAAQCVLESGAKVPEQVLAMCKHVWLPLLTDVEREPRPEGRAAIGRALGRLGLDDRKGVGVRNGVPDIDWVGIPAGEFRYQGKSRKIKAAFSISRYLVTNAQYAAFLSASDGYEQDRWWEGFSNPDRRKGEPAWTEGNHPRETVNWWEAMAFCAWLSERLGYEVRLPTEWEWERAAGGVEGREYPWGNGYLEGSANVAGTLGGTSPVGMYPQGAAKEGAQCVDDLAGNVREWCLNEYHKPARVQKSGEEPRVLRGGSWYGGQELARSASRLGWHPDGRSNDVGFRVVCSSPHPRSTDHWIADH